MTWGKTFTVCVTDTTGITRAALVAPGATTHGQDQNQRYVPLTFTRSPYGQKLYVTAPSDSNIAPPGYYMLFLTGARAGGSHYPDVPSIAKWIRVRRALRDTCDAVAPRIMTDFFVDAIGQTTADLAWSEHADDSVTTGSGWLQKFDLRSSLSAISNESEWSGATDTPGEPAPAGPGSGHGQTLTALACNTRYYLAMRSLDDNQNLSLLYSLNFKTLSAGCGSLMAGDGAGSARMGAAGSARQSGSSHLSERSASAAALESGASTGPLVVETSLLENGQWSVRSTRITEADGITPAESGEILVQVRTDDGAWKTVNRIPQPEVGGVIGLSSLRERGRFVLPAGYQIEQVAGRHQGKAGEVAAQSVTHSSLGSLTTTDLVDPVATDLAAGQSLTVIYEAAAAGGEESASWHLLVRRVPVAPEISQGGSGSAAPLPTRYGLSQNAPNPFAANTRIEFQLPREGRVRLEIYDLLGRRVRTLTEAVWPAGRHALAWDRTTDAGVRLSSGVFVYRLTAEGFRDQKRMVLLSR